MSRDGPYDVFISYRRTDSAIARLLLSALQEVVGQGRVFFDNESIAIGDKFPSRLHDALVQSQVVLVVISDDWGEALAERLEQGRMDYVRFELELALEQDKAIVPVLIEDTKMPQLHLLPPSLRELAEINAASVRLDARHNSDMRDLVYSVRDRLRRFRDGGRVNTRLLPLLCDRESQNACLEPVVQPSAEPAAPAVCLIYGAADQSLLGYLECLQHRHIPRWRELVDGQCHRIDVTLPKTAPADMDWISRLLARSLGMRMDESNVRSIMARIAADPLPTLVTASLDTQDWCRTQQEVVSTFANFWTRLREPPRSRPVLVVIQLEFPPVVTGILHFLGLKSSSQCRRQAIVKWATDLTAKGIILVPELEGVKRKWAEHWATDTEVQAVAGYDPLFAVRELYPTLDYVIPMERLEVKLRDILRGT